MERPEPGRVEVRVLGALEAAVEGQAVVLGAAKVRALLAILAVHPGQVLSADRLAEALWGESPPPSAANTLQGYVSQLRRALGTSAIVTRAPGYMLALAPDATDAGRFEELLTRARTAAAQGRADEAATVLEEALGLWRGPALGEFAYESFAQAAATRLEEARLAATEELAEGRLYLGRHAELVGPLRALVDQHPLRERMWGQLALALYRCGRQAEALRALAEVRRRLGEELGIDPSPVLQHLEDAILAQKPELEWRPGPDRLLAPAATVHNLPRSRSTFVGRARELDELAKLLAIPGPLTIVGPGGVGKTRLAVEAARGLLGGYPDGVWLVELAALSDQALVPDALAAALNLSERRGWTMMDTVVSALADKRALVLLDNCEHVLGTTAVLVDKLMAASPCVTVLATSREPLRVEGEVVWRASPLAAPSPDEPVSLEEGLAFDAVRLFCERAQAHRRLSLDAENAQAIITLCRRLDGIPLALELAAARTLAMSPSQILDHLDDRFALLTDGPRAVLPRHRTLRAALDWSFELLDLAEQTLLARLSVFAAGFSLSAAEAVCGGRPLVGSGVAPCVASLVAKSLVVVDARGLERYHLLETVRDYAAERLAGAADPVALRRSFAQWAVGIVEPAAMAYEAEPDIEAWLARVRPEMGNVMSALSWAVAAAPDLGVRLAGSMGPFWSRIGPMAEGRKWLEVALGAAPGPDLGARARALRWFAFIATASGDYEDARRALGDAVRYATDAGDLRQRAGCLRLLAYPASQLGDFEAAREYLAAAAAAYREIGEEAGEIDVLVHLGGVASDQGDYALARTCLSRALQYRRRQGRTSMIATCAHNLGYARATWLRPARRSRRRTPSFARSATATASGLPRATSH